MKIVPGGGNTVAIKIGPGESQSIDLRKTGNQMGLSMKMSTRIYWSTNSLKFLFYYFKKIKLFKNIKIKHKNYINFTTFFNIFKFLNY